MAFSVFFKRGLLKDTGYPLGNGGVVFGRSSVDSDLKVEHDDNSVSRRHVELRVADGKVTLANLASLEGTTKVDGAPVPLNGSVELKPGSEVVLGSRGSVAFVLRQDEVSPYSWQDQPESGAHLTATGATAGAAALSQDMDEIEMTSALPVDYIAVAARHEPTGDDAVPPDATDAFAANFADIEQRRYIEPTDVGGELGGTEVETDSETDGKTRENKTIVAGDGDFQKINIEEKRRRLLHRIKMFSLLLGAFAAISTAYFLMRPRPEAVLTWPKDAAGKYDMEKINLDTKFGSKAFKLFVPSRLDINIVSKTNDHLKLVTRIGANRDVPFYVEFFCRCSPSNVTMSRDALLSRELSRFESSDKWNFQSKSSLAFIGSDNGLPYIDVQYLRSVETDDGTEQRYGQMLFATYADAILVVLREIPAFEQWRGTKIVASDPLLDISHDAQLARWEGRHDWRNSPVASLLAEADGLLALKSPYMWKDVEYLLQSALIVSTVANSREEGDVDEFQRIIERLKQLRTDEKKEFNRLRISWESHDRLGEKAECKADMNEALRVFTMPDDARNARLQKGGWR